MFDWTLFACLMLVCVPGILVSVPGTIKTMEKLASDQLPEGRALPPRSVLILASAAQTLVIIAIPAAIGTALAPTVGLHAPAFEALAAGEPVWLAIQPQLFPSLVVGVAGALVFVAAYYRLFRSRLDAHTVQAWEGLRQGIGIWSRVLYGGIAEEVLARWGLMTLFAWLGTLVVGGPTPVVMWTAIVLSGVLFGLGHAPGYLAAGCKRSPIFFTAMISLNLWASLIFGWLFWQYGLLAAMLGHALFHVVWWPFDLRQARATAGKPTA